ncbi:MAG TPA: hypothetical protein VFB59_04770 [Candidatus Saccharimonadales bacterium]|nr:hypothetical protein [Candidatus Saccharimonadales bacterium]
MKTNTQKHNHHKKPFHLHVEHFFRMRALLVMILGLLMLAIVRSDSKLLGMVREAYAEGYGLVGAYMREETVRTPATFATVRASTISGR